MRIYNNQFITNQSLGASFNSDPRELFNMFGYSIQVVYTGTPNGTLKLQASSSDNNPNTTLIWSDIPSSSTTIVAAGNFMWNVTDVFYNFVRVVYTDASGGTSTAVLTSGIINCKGV